MRKSLLKYTFQFRLSSKTKIHPMEGQLFWLTPRLFLMMRCPWGCGTEHQWFTPPVPHFGMRLSSPPSGWVSPLPCPRLYPMGISLWSKDGQCEKGVPRGQEWGTKTRLNSGNFWRAIWAPWDGWRLLLVHHSVYFILLLKPASGIVAETSFQWTSVSVNSSFELA